MAVDASDIVIEQGHTGIVTCNDWFKAADGNQYKHAAGPIYYFEAEEMMGFVPKESANWFVVVGDVGNESHGERQVIAGCQVHYANIVPDASHLHLGAQNVRDLTL